MSNGASEETRAAEVVLPCDELDDALSFFTGRLGFRIEMIFPADDPAVAVLCGHGVRLRLQRRGDGADPQPAQLAPPPSFVVCAKDDASWTVGRAGMRYRDLVPGRQGGGLIASHIQIPDGGKVADYVHYHKVGFQMIYCYRGWVRVVYEDQGPPFVMQPGDCVLQPPRIRHRVLECSAGMEVIELASPAAHQTCADHDLPLPTPTLQPGRDFGGQRFVRHQAAAAESRPGRIGGFLSRDLGIAGATANAVSAQVLRRAGPLAAAAASSSCQHDAQFLFAFVLGGGVTLWVEGHGVHRLAAGAAFLVPAGPRYGLLQCTDDLELLEVVALQKLTPP